MIFVNAGRTRNDYDKELVSDVYDELERRTQMSKEYDIYLESHKTCVRRAYGWIKEYLPELLEKCSSDIDRQIERHDASKNMSDEYEAYDKYFYSSNACHMSHETLQNFKKSWLLHIHRNPHHWQYWVLINDDPEEGIDILDMPYDYIIEMICDWWSFSWAKGDLFEIFKWYDKHKNHIRLSYKTRKTVQNILMKMKEELHNREVEE